MPELLFLLFFKPSLFFKHIHALRGRYTLQLLALSYGVAGAIDRISLKTGPGQDTWSPKTWGEFWLYAILAGRITGMLIHFIGEWWFKLRLKWSGERTRDRTLVRKVFLFAG